MPSPGVDYYELLQVPRWASSAEIRAAYLQLARVLHPDLNPGDPQSDAGFKRLQEAYEVLLDRDRRARYDAQVLWPAMRASGIRPVSAGLAVIPPGRRTADRRRWSWAACMVAVCLVVGALLAAFGTSPSRLVQRTRSTGTQRAHLVPEFRLEPRAPVPPTAGKALSDQPPARRTRQAITQAMPLGRGEPEGEWSSSPQSEPELADGQPVQSQPGTASRTGNSRESAPWHNLAPRRQLSTWIPTGVAADLEFARPEPRKPAVSGPYPSSERARREPDRPWRYSPSLAIPPAAEARVGSTAVSFRSSWLWTARTMAVDERLGRRAYPSLIERDRAQRPSRPSRAARLARRIHPTWLAASWAGISVPGMAERDAGWPPALKYTAAPAVWPGTYGPLGPPGEQDPAPDSEL